MTGAKPIDNAGNYLNSAPAELITLRQQVSKGADILERLLTSKSMRRPWRYIDRRIEQRKAAVSRGTAYARLWGELLTVRQRAKRLDVSRAVERGKWRGVAHDAGALANKVKGTSLDVPVFEFYPRDVATLVFGDEWTRADNLRRHEIANRVAADWPTLAECLDQVAADAGMRAALAMTRPRLVERETRDREANYFIRGMAQYFTRTFDGPMEGSLAALASVVLGQDIDLAFVNRSLRGSKNKPFNKTRNTEGDLPTV